MTQFPRAWVAAFTSILTLSVAVPAVAQSLSTREALMTIMPAAMEVVADIEHELGRQLADDELPTVLHSQDFERRLGQRVKADPAFVPCRIEHCLLA